MSNPVVSVQVCRLAEPPRGAVWFGLLAAALCTAVEGLAHAIAGAPAVHRESRHA